MSLPWETLIGLALLGFLSLALPFVPAARTLKQPPDRLPPKDATLLPQVQCETFRHVISRQFGNLLNLARTQGTLKGETEKGRRYIVLGINSHLVNEIASGQTRLKTMLIAAGHLDIPGELVCDREIYAEGKINIGHNTMARCVLSPRDIAINTRARVTRWVRSDRRLDVAEGAWVKGWANAGTEISIARRARFEQLGAPQINFGRQPDIKHFETEVVGRYTPPQTKDGQPKYVRELSVADNHVVRGDLIVIENLKIGNECRVIGDLRAGKTLVIGAYSTLEGTLYCDGSIVIEEGCRLTGPIIAKGSILIHSACQIGSPEHPTTAIAPRIKIAEGCTAHGTVWATQRGEVYLQE